RFDVLKATTIREDTQQFQALVNLLSSACLLIDQNRRISNANELFFKLLPTASHDIIDRPLDHGGLPVPLATAIASAITAPDRTKDTEVRIEDPAQPSSPSRRLGVHVECARDEQGRLKWAIVLVDLRVDHATEPTAAAATEGPDVANGTARERPS
ncbi:MAG: hypothetical protein HY815_12035, partial [Candidatus Riflebacteria bacterium]|nr:hypothetical protein [Candidatus Riflebacteria bacterium]